MGSPKPLQKTFLLIKLFFFSLWELSVSNANRWAHITFLYTMMRWKSCENRIVIRIQISIFKIVFNDQYALRMIVNYNEREKVMTSLVEDDCLRILLLYIHVIVNVPLLLVSNMVHCWLYVSWCIIIIFMFKQCIY